MSAGTETDFPEGTPMSQRRAWCVVIFLICVVSLSAGDAPTAKKNAAPKKSVVAWKKTVVDRAFHSEGVAVADVNKDGKPDIIVGDVWYEAPDWKMHILRKDPGGDPQKPKYDPKGYNPLGYSHSFGVFSDDFNGDGWPDVIVMPFPGAPCLWYQNPGKKGGLWKEHVVSNSACNETPLYVDLFGTGKRVIVMGVQPKGQDNMGQMFWLRPGKDPTQPWEHHPISEPSAKDKIIPGTFRFSHGLGVGDVNGDGRRDVICTAGWWEQPATLDDQPWKFHPADLGPDCADMHVFDIDGDGKNDIISSSAHQVGLWWHQHKPGKTEPTFVRNEMLLGSLMFKDQKNYPLRPEEKTLVDLVNQHRAKSQLPALRPVSVLCKGARAETESDLSRIVEGYKGEIQRRFLKNAEAFKKWIESESNDKLILGKWTEVGVGHRLGDMVLLLGATWSSPNKGIVLWENMKKQLVSQTHALHFVDINGDGLKDLVTGRRFWAHGPSGDALPTEPAYLFWFEARKGSDGIVTFIPHVIDDDSGIGTQFAVEDINGDGLPDIIVSNKKGVFIFEQVRTPLPDIAPPGKQ